MAEQRRLTKAAATERDFMEALTTKPLATASRTAA